MEWFNVDKEGLAKLLEKKGKAFALFELIQNAWDTDAKHVDVRLIPVPNSPHVELIVEDDDPDGFADLSHSFTLFAESAKKGDPEKRGRFNLGEKLVLALCKTASVESTRGSITFDERGRTKRNFKRASGSRFCGIMRMTREEQAEVSRAVHDLLPPAGVETTFNGPALEVRPCLTSFEHVLPTETADSEGYLRRTERKTTVEIFEPRPGQVASLYEMGIPVVETADRWLVNIFQKVPLNADRDNVTPAYLQKVRVAVLNHMHARLSKEDATQGWVRDAAAHPDAAQAAVETVMTKRFGEKRVISDPNDPEGTKLAMSQGYTVIPGGSLSGGEWQNVKKFGAALPAGQVTPSPKPYSEDGDRAARLIPVEKWTDGMRRVVIFARKFHAAIVDGHPSRTTLHVDMVSEITLPWGACYGPGDLQFNVGRLGKNWFERVSDEELVELLIHEFGHHYSRDHLSAEYHDALCRLGAKLASFIQGRTFDVFR